MGTESVYYTPLEQAKWKGRACEVARKLYDAGVFATTHAEWLRKAGKTQPALPRCAVDIDRKADSFGIVDAEKEVTVPEQPYQIKCPSCDCDVTDAAWTVWDEDEDRPLRDRIVKCSHCGSSTRSENLKFEEPVAFVNFYIWVLDCSKEDWPAEGFKHLLEGLLGPCNEYWEWTT